MIRNLGEGKNQGRRISHRRWEGKEGGEDDLTGKIVGARKKTQKQK